MKAYSDDELAELLAERESGLLELKESLEGSAPNKVRVAVCAFANDLAARKRAGVVFIGFRDDGTSSGLEITDELLRQLADIRTDGQILPPPSLVVERRVIHGSPVAVVTVFPLDSTPVRYQGRIWIRTGPRRALASVQDERVLNERRRFSDRPYDLQPLRSASLEDLDLDRFRLEYLRVAVAAGVLEANERTLEQQLAATKMIVGEDVRTPTVLGALVCGKAARDLVGGLRPRRRFVDAR